MKDDEFEATVKSLSPIAFKALLCDRDELPLFVGRGNNVSDKVVKVRLEVECAGPQEKSQRSTQHL